MSGVEKQTKATKALHWSDEYRNEVIKQWQTIYIKQVGIISTRAEVVKTFIPIMLKICVEQFKDEAIAHNLIDANGNEIDRNKTISTLYQRYKSWIGIPNKIAIEKGEEPPYGLLVEKQNKDVTVDMIDEVRCKDEVKATAGLLQVDIPEKEVNFTTTTAEIPFYRYNVSFRYKVSKGIFSPYTQFHKIYEGYTEAQAYLKALEELFGVIGYDKVKIDNRSIRVAQIG